jgi:hypothetical protein
MLCSLYYGLPVSSYSLRHLSKVVQLDPKPAAWSGGDLLDLKLVRRRPACKMGRLAYKNYTNLPVL